MGTMSDLLELEGKKIVITGAASGIGRATAVALAGLGARLLLLDFDATGLDGLASELSTGGREIRTRTLSVSDADAVEAAFASVDEAWGSPDVLIHVAGIMREQGADIRDISLDSWSNVLSINLTGSFLVAQAAAKRMIPAGSGTVILVGSGAGVIGASGSIPYGASKGGVNGLAMTLEHYLHPHGIRVHNFCPGSVDTPLVRKSLDERVANGGEASAVAPILAAAISSDTVGRALALLASPLAGPLKGNIFTR